MKVLLTGSTGQLGQALIRSLPTSLSGESVQLVKCARSSSDADIVVDLADHAHLQDTILSLRPDWVINAGAYTAVDQAEADPHKAARVNTGAPSAVAKALKLVGGKLLQISTDFVFNGRQSTPYLPSQDVDPLGVYGATKAAGEQAIRDTLPLDRYCILRTSWVYGPVGKNFLLTMLRLQSERDQISVVSDQVGSPTSTASLAAACWSILAQDLTGLHHWCDAGVASWYDFAVAISELGFEAGLIQQPTTIKPIGTSDYPTPATRPNYSVLNTTSTRTALGIDPSHWRTELKSVIDDRQSLLSAPPNGI